VGAGIAFALHLLAQNADDQAKCIEELDEIFGDDKDRVPTMNDLRGMKYLEMCIKETLRLYPSVPSFGRTISEPIRVGDYYLPSGSEIFITPWITHRLPHLYPEPERFIPERFSPENCEKRHPYAYIPFSAGPRNCIGHKFAIIEMKVVLSNILRHYKLLPVPGKTKVTPVYRVTVRATGGLWVQLEER
jgi:cytochrome P450 family 4